MNAILRKNGRLAAALFALSVAAALPGCATLPLPIPEGPPPDISLMRGSVSRIELPLGETVGEATVSDPGLVSVRVSGGSVSLQPVGGPGETDILVVPAGVPAGRRYHLLVP